MTETINQIEFSCLGSQSGFLKRAERLTAPLYKTTTRLLMGFQSTSSQKDDFRGVVKVHAVKMGLVHLIMEQTWQTNAQGKFSLITHLFSKVFRLSDIGRITGAIGIGCLNEGAFLSYTGFGCD